MAELINSKTISIANNAFDFKIDGAYTFDFSKNFVQVKLDKGQNTNISDAAFNEVASFDFEGVTSLNLAGIGFTAADAAADYKFEPDAKLDALLKDLIASKGVTGALSVL